MSEETGGEFVTTEVPRKESGVGENVTGTTRTGEITKVGSENTTNESLDEKSSLRRQRCIFDGGPLGMDL